MNPVALQIQEEITREGPISFARFMELALYAPGLGYYERQREIGRRGDFYTSVSVGSLFGELLAFQFAQWLGESELTGCKSSKPVRMRSASGGYSRMAATLATGGIFKGSIHPHRALTDTMRMAGK